MQDRFFIYLSLKSERIYEIHPCISPSTLRFQASLRLFKIVPDNFVNLFDTVPIPRPTFKNKKPAFMLNERLVFIFSFGRGERRLEPKAKVRMMNP